MTTLNREERRELVAFSRSRTLRNDLRRMAKEAIRIAQKNAVRGDVYLDFLMFANEFMGHAPKPFEKMDGTHFKL